MNFITYFFKSKNQIIVRKFSKDKYSLVFKEIKNKLGKLVFNFFIKCFILDGLFYFNEFETLSVKFSKIDILNNNDCPYFEKFPKLLKNYIDNDYILQEVEEKNFIKILFFSSILTIISKHYENLKEEKKYCYVVGNYFQNNIHEIKNNYNSEITNSVFEKSNFDYVNKIIFGILLFKHIEELVVY